jgi:hypothetical protein
VQGESEKKAQGNSTLRNLKDYNEPNSQKEVIRGRNPKARARKYLSLDKLSTNGH